MESLKLGNLEYLILNYAIKDRAFWLKIFEALKPSYFEKEDNQKIFTYLKKYFEKYSQLPDYQIVANELRDIDQTALTSVFSSPKEDTKGYIYDSTLDFIKENMMREELLGVIDLLEKRESDRFEKIESRIKKVIRFNLDTSLGIKLADVDTRYARIAAMERNAFPLECHS